MIQEILLQWTNIVPIDTMKFLSGAVMLLQFCTCVAEMGICLLFAFSRLTFLQTALRHSLKL